LLPSTFVVFTEGPSTESGSLGSGFALVPDCVMTNAHVVAGATSVTIQAVRGSTRRHAAEVIAVDERRDLALLKVSNLAATGVQIAYHGPEVGERIYVAGNPAGLVGSFSEGLVSALRQDRGCRLFQMTAPIAPGSSGGPVVNCHGALVGVSVGVRGTGENLNFAIHLEEVLRFAQENGFRHPAMQAK